MTITSLSGKSATITLALDEILTINQALNEVCNGIELGSEFETRMGCSLDEARRLLAEVNQLARQIMKS